MEKNDQAYASVVLQCNNITIIFIWINNMTQCNFTGVIFSIGRAEV